MTTLSATANRMSPQRAGFTLQAYDLGLAVRRGWKTRFTPWVYARVACLGLDVHKQIGARYSLVNTQKGRADMLLRYGDNPRLRPATRKLAGHFQRQDILPLVAQQAVYKWKRARGPVACYLDSYSELTDQLFVNRMNGWEFCANYSDIAHTREFSREYDCRGLLPVEQIEPVYRHFLATLSEVFGTVPVIFLVFPPDLEERTKFRLRHDAIVAAVTMLQPEFPHLHVIRTRIRVQRPAACTHAESDFPYHYDAATYGDFAEQIKGLGLTL